MSNMDLVNVWRKWLFKPEGLLVNYINRFCLSWDAKKPDQVIDTIILYLCSRRHSYFFVVDRYKIKVMLTYVVSCELQIREKKFPCFLRLYVSRKLRWIFLLLLIHNLAQKNVLELLRVLSTLLFIIKVEVNSKCFSENMILRLAVRVEFPSCL
jgi:hypothetical protein